MVMVKDRDAVLQTENKDLIEYLIRLEAEMEIVDKNIIDYIDWKGKNFPKTIKKEEQ